MRNLEMQICTEYTQYKYAQNGQNIKNVVIILRISRWMKYLSSFHFLNYICKDMNLHKYPHSGYDSTSVYANSHFYEYN